MRIFYCLSFFLLSIATGVRAEPPQPVQKVGVRCRNFEFMRGLEGHDVVGARCKGFKNLDYEKIPVYIERTTRPALIEFGIGKKDQKNPTSSHSVIADVKSSQFGILAYLGRDDESEQAKEELLDRANVHLTLESEKVEILSVSFPPGTEFFLFKQGSELESIGPDGSLPTPERIVELLRGNSR